MRWWQHATSPDAISRWRNSRSQLGACVAQAMCASPCKLKNRLDRPWTVWRAGVRLTNAWAVRRGGPQRDGPPLSAACLHRPRPGGRGCWRCSNSTGLPTALFVDSTAPEASEVAHWPKMWDVRASLAALTCLLLALLTASAAAGGMESDGGFGVRARSRAGRHQGRSAAAARPTAAHCRCASTIEDNLLVFHSSGMAWLDMESRHQGCPLPSLHSYPTAALPAPLPRLRRLHSRSTCRLPPTVPGAGTSPIYRLWPGRWPDGGGGWVGQGSGGVCRQPGGALHRLGGEPACTMKCNGAT